MNSLTNDDFINSVDLSIENDNSNKSPIDVKASLDDVNERIAMAMSDVEAYSTQLESNNTPPSIEKEWYQLPVVTPKELNTVLNNFHGFVYRSFNLVKCVLDTQNENAKSICNLIYLIAAGEAQLYGQLKGLAIIDQEDIEKLKILEKRFLESLELNEGDKKAAHKQLVCLIDYTQAIDDIKTKWIRGLEVKINDIYNTIDRDIEKAITELETSINIDRQELEDSINTIKKEVDEQINILNETKEGVNRQRIELQKQRIELQKTIDSLPNKTRELCDERFKTMQQTLSTNQESFQTNILQTINGNFKLQDDKLARQDVEINKLKRKSFFDSKVYKIGIGIIAIAALVCSLVL